MDGITLTFRWEPLSYLLTTGLEALGARSWEENGYEKDLLQYAPDWVKYGHLEAQDILRFMAVREEGILVGYASVIVTSSFHDCRVCCAIVQDIYLAPESRKGLAGVKFLWVLEEQLKGIGVNNLSIAERTGGVPTGRIFERLGFRSDERIWTKHIAGNA